MPSCHDHLAPVDCDRISAVSILSSEHRVILQLLSALAVMAARSAAGDLPTADAKDALGYTALMWAAHGGWTDTVKVLLAAKANPGLKSGDGLTARELALKRGHTSTADEIPR